ncbi:MAG TPA: glycosyltransferase family 25 protein, partial [Bacteroidales bacterium]|nr:glycosyltransferase family 25 protein [Bacteroidales bacterium]
MDRVPRTFCITLRETPKRQEAAQKYFKEINWPVEFFKGIHGESFGLKSTIPNYNKLPGREYFITQGAIGCLLSHLMLWNVLIYQPEDEFLILEDDIKLADDFSDRYKKFRKELPDDWQIVYLGHLIPGGLKEKGIIHISENVIVCKPMCTHAYMVKKSALKILIETNQLAWSPLDIQIIERSLPKLKHYAVKDPLITQQSVLNIKDETWYSLCYDWDLNPEWVTDKSNNIRLGSGWHPLEKNDDGYMIWTDGRGEFLFDDKWQKMDFEFIAEGEIEKKIRIVCPQHPDQIIDLPQYGKNNVSVSIQGAKSVILVSDTFRPIDIFKTSDSRRLGLRLLKGITLTDSEGKSTFVSLYSMYGAK